jgi:hypothetical protein
MDGFHLQCNELTENRIINFFPVFSQFFASVSVSFGTMFKYIQSANPGFTFRLNT